MNKTVRIDLQLSERQLDWLKQEATQWSKEHDGYQYSWRNVLVGICLNALNHRMDKPLHDSVGSTITHIA